MTTMTLDEWRAAGRALGNGSLLDCGFRCPQCGHVATPSDFGRAGADHDRAWKECIGRVVEGQGCDWAAFGLLGTLGKGIYVVIPDSLRVVEVFPFA